MPQQGCVDLTLLLLQSIADGCMGAGEGREELRRRKRTLFIHQLNFKTTKEPLKQQEARTTTSSGDANAFHSPLLWTRIFIKTYTVHMWSPLRRGSLPCAKFTERLQVRGNKHRHSVWDWFMKTKHAERHKQVGKSDPALRKPGRVGGALFLRDLIICWVSLQKVLQNGQNDNSVQASGLFSKAHVPPTDWWSSHGHRHRPDMTKEMLLYFNHIWVTAVVWN